MCQTSLSVWFVCRLCRGSFGQVDAFIEHKKQKHFTQFQNTTSIVFEERDIPGLLFPEDSQLQDESNPPPIKIEVTDEDPIIPLSSEIVYEPNLAVVEPKNELITYENEIIPEVENNFFGFGLEQPEQNPYVLLKRLTPEEIQIACFPQHHSRLSTFEQKRFLSNSEPHPYVSLDVNSNIRDLIEVKKSTENQPSSTVTCILTEDDDLQFECKLCSKKFQSDARLKIHVGICALYHENRNRFCVTCNRKFNDVEKLKDHRLRLHGTEEEKLSLQKFKCHVCQKQYREFRDLKFHLESHKKNTEQVKATDSISKRRSRKCPHPNCRKEFENYSELQGHVTVHFEVKPFSCPFRSCNKTFTHGGLLTIHFRTHNATNALWTAVTDPLQQSASDRNTFNLPIANLLN